MIREHIYYKVCCFYLLFFLPVSKTAFIIIIFFLSRIIVCVLKQLTVIKNELEKSVLV